MHLPCVYTLWFMYLIPSLVLFVPSRECCIDVLYYIYVVPPRECVVLMCYIIYMSYLPGSVLYWCAILYICRIYLPGSVLYWWIWQDGAARPGGHSRGNGAADHLHHQGRHQGNAQRPHLHTGSCKPNWREIRQEQVAKGGSVYVETLYTVEPLIYEHLWNEDTSPIRTPFLSPNVSMQFNPWIRAPFLSPNVSMQFNPWIRTPHLYTHFLPTH